MTRTKYLRYLSGLANEVAGALSAQADLCEIDDQKSNVDCDEVIQFTNHLRARLLWIERAAHDIKAD